jgi:hypothetical protein
MLMQCKKSFRYQRGNQNPQIEERQTIQWSKERQTIQWSKERQTIQWSKERQTIQWSKEKGQRDKQRSTKHHT